jgi:hypothetical protein
MRSFSLLVRTAVLAGTLLGAAPAALTEGSSAPEPSFSPTWKLLRNDAKQQFIAGYLFGWRDAKRVTEVAIEYVRENPSEAVRGLERIRGLYNMEGITAESMVRELDTFFSESEGKDATLSQAITAARMRLGR